ncbi:MAG: alpha/beta fold hydrolase [Pseudomonadota bacterium]
MLRTFVAALASIVFGQASSVGQTQTTPPIEAYGQLPAMSYASLSPDGDKLAFIARNETNNVLLVLDLATNESVGIGIGDLKTESVEWSGPEHIIFRAFDNTRVYGYRGRFRYSGAVAINVTTQKNKLLLQGTRDLYPAQSGLGHIVGKLGDSGQLLMPAYVGGQNPRYSLLTVDPDRGRGRSYSSGRTDTIDWFVDEGGTILAQENYDNESNRYWIRTQANEDGEWETIFESERENGPLGLIGVTPDKSSLIFSLTGSNGFIQLYGLSMSGDLTGHIIGRDDADVSRVISNLNRVVFGVEYGGLRPTYEFFDETLQTDIERVQATFPETSTQLLSWTDNWSKLLFMVSGTGHAGDYFLFDRDAQELTFLSSSRPDIPRGAIADVLTVEYPATDGLTIPGVLTAPAGIDINNLPLIALPHGGPESHDQVEFHWMAQYFASRGYLVLQPNFRGSDGFGTDFVEAGYGEWGGAMQQDITDGVEALIASGRVDPDRICIVGWSYGGYAALAGGAYTPDLYRCIAAIAPVSDLPRMLIDERRDHGDDHWVVNYWEKAMADGEATRDFLRERSPAMYADEFQAPVLLLHGRDDLVVPVSQSRRMRRALRNADKDVRLVEYRGEDHSMSTPGARLEVLQELDAFISEHIGMSAN